MVNSPPAAPPGVPPGRRWERGPAQTGAIGQPLGNDLAVEGLHRKGVDGGVAPGERAPGRRLQVIPGALPPGDPIESVGRFGLHPGSQPCSHL